MCTETSSPPRLSFSLDLTADEGAETRRDTALLDMDMDMDMDMDFEFNVGRNAKDHPAPAEFLFGNGVILPSRVQGKHDDAGHRKAYTYEPPPLVSTPSSLPPLPPRSRVSSNASRDPGREIFSDTLTMSLGSQEADHQKKSGSKSFWGFKRSLSLNYDIKKSLMCSFPRLSRSNSTGSFTDSKSATLKQAQKQISRRLPVPSPGTNPSLAQSPSSSSLCSHSVPPKFPVKRTSHGTRSHNGNSGSSVRPFLSLPPYVPKFGFGSFLGNSKEKKTKKKSFML